MRKLLAFSLILLLALSGCAVFDRIDAESQSKIPAEHALFFDDFQTDSRYWKTWEDENGSIQIKNGFLYFLLEKPNFDYWSLTGNTYWNTITAVDSEFIAGPKNNTFGVVCRFQDPTNFYQFVISDDGYGGIIRVQNGEYTNLAATDGLVYGEMIHKDGGKNLIRADCIDDQLRLVVNQQVLAEAQDSAFSQGKVGLIAGTSETGKLTLSFDNFTVVKP